MIVFDLTKAEAIAQDLSVFADIGTDPPTVEDTSEGFVVRLVRNGQMTELTISPRSGSISETVEDRTTKHANLKALLASDRYGSLREWSNNQRIHLDNQATKSGSLIKLNGVINSGSDRVDLEYVDAMLSSPQNRDSTRIMLIDGPAGIGKTQFILSLSAERAKRYSVNRRPLILHVQSRGRTLSHIYDLMAFSLQSLRIDATFDQVPILAKYGLVTIAIDGFDELADPDGYGLAWAQVSDVVANLRGLGSIILAGRETFIGKHRIMKDIASIREDVDEISVLTLQSPTKSEAIAWLKGTGWREEQLRSVERFLEPSSMALRPFFLKTLSDISVADRVAKSTSSSVLSILVDAMIERETDKFGVAVELALNHEERQQYIRNLMGEVARDMADNSSAAVSEATLSWLVEVALPTKMPESTLRILKARSQVLAFLTNDERAGYRCFYHEKFFEYFLCRVLIDTISHGEKSKPVARNIFGSSILETFGSVISSGTPVDRVAIFLREACIIIRDCPPIDRTSRNVAALLIASLAVADLVNNFSLNDVDIDEARFTGTASTANLNRVVISQFDVRGADLSAVRFVDCTILTLIADGETRLPNDFPAPVRIQDIVAGDGFLSEPLSVKKWIAKHSSNPPDGVSGIVPLELKSHPALRLLEKACRLRQYWLRRGDDAYASRILEHEYWPLIESILKNHGLLKEEYRQASGTDARFVHVRQPEDILAENTDNHDVVKFYGELLRSLARLSSVPASTEGG